MIWHHILILLSLYKLPDVVLGNMIRVKRAARHFIQQFAFRNFNLMRMQIILGFKIAEDDRFLFTMRFSGRTELVQ